MTIEIFEQVSSSTLSRISYMVGNARDEITVRINSSGGEVFAALSIYNVLKGKCNVEILGLAASAASLIACAGKRITIARNALFMIHAPKTLLVDYYDKQTLEKLSNTLAKTEENILQAYQTRVPNFQMPEDDLWLSASEAKSLGFVDEIIGEVPVVIDEQGTFINSIAYDAAQIKGLKERLHPTPKTDTALETLLKMIKDNQTSGAQGVGSQPLTAEDIKQVQLNKMIAFANGKVI